MELLHPDNWPQRIAGYIEDIASNGSSHFEVVRQTRSGQKRTIEVTAAAVRSVTGEIVGISKVHRDVTGLRQADRRLRSVLDNLFAFVGVLTPDGTLLEANRAPLEAAGIEAKDVVGKKFWDCYWWSYSRDTQDQLQEAARAPSRVNWFATMSRSASRMAGCCGSISSWRRWWGPTAKY